MAAIFLEGALLGASFAACHPGSVSLASRSAYNQQVAGKGQAGLPNGREEGEEKVLIARKGAWSPGRWEVQRIEVSQGKGKEGKGKRVLWGRG